jgi:hypothetical protein
VTAQALTQANDLFLHVRVIISVILGLSIGRLLQGLASFVEHPGKQKVSAIHLGWVIWALLSVIGYWWWEFSLNHITDWTFGRYLFIFAYASCYFLICAMLFPGDLDEYGGYAGYFLSRRKWFFGLVALTFALDIGDTLLKGTAYVHALGPVYVARALIWMIACALGAMIVARRFQIGLAYVAILAQLGFFFAWYDRLG